MNQSEILRLLLNTLSQFDVHQRLITELTEIIVGSGYEARFFKLFISRLKLLSQYGVDAVKFEEFELIGGGVFSMHLAKKGFNIRILYSFFPNGRPSLLTCFHERAGKFKTNYSTYIQPATNRFKERLEVYEHGRHE